MQEPQSRRRGSTAKRRRGARQKAMQALYQWDFDQAAHSPEHIVEQFCSMQNMDKVDVEYFEALFTYAAENVADIDAEISAHLDRKLDQLDPIERSVLRVCCTELKTQLGTPYKVVVNEALEISKDFGADKGYRYINGIADKLAGSLRKIEYTRDHPDGNPLSEQEIKEPRARTTPQSNVKISMKEKPEATDEGKSRSSADRYAGPDRKVPGKEPRHSGPADKKHQLEKPVTTENPEDRSAKRKQSAENSSTEKAPEASLEKDDSTGDGTTKDRGLANEELSKEASTEDKLTEDRKTEVSQADPSGSDLVESELPDQDSEEELPADSPWAQSPWAKKSSTPEQTDDDDQDAGKKKE